uniref:Uncharacterized protein n=1 Tax=mine drainage metagenome TaxID=410659 RepID=E6QH63_9ZZZZ
MDVSIRFPLKNAMHEESTDSQKTLESLVPDGVAALDIPSATISHTRSRSVPSSRSSRNADFWSRWQHPQHAAPTR